MCWMSFAINCRSGSTLGSVKQFRRKALPLVSGKKQRRHGLPMLDVLESGPDWPDTFNEQLFSDLVEKIVVINNEKLCFRLLNGLEVTEKIERTQR